VAEYHYLCIGFFASMKTYTDEEIEQLIERVEALGGYL